MESIPHSTAWQILLLLVLQCMSKTDDPMKCRPLRDDYLECLHHRKEVRPAVAVYSAVWYTMPPMVSFCGVQPRVCARIRCIASHPSIVRHIGNAH